MPCSSPTLPDPASDESEALDDLLATDPIDLDLNAFTVDPLDIEALLADSTPDLAAFQPELDVDIEDLLSDDPSVDFEALLSTPTVDLDEFLSDDGSKTVGELVSGLASQADEGLPDDWT